MLNAIAVKLHSQCLVVENALQNHPNVKSFAAIPLPAITTFVKDTDATLVLALHVASPARRSYRRAGTCVQPLATMKHLSSKQVCLSLPVHGNSLQSQLSFRLHFLVPLVRFLYQRNVWESMR